MSIKTLIVIGKAFEAYIPDLARLRITVFREYPYLYDGTEAYEQDYLQTYMASGSAMAVLAFDGSQVIGASTGIPMADETAEFKQPFMDKGIDLETLFYCGESVLLPRYRGKGIYKQFFSGREDYARSLGSIEKSCFCAIVRPDNHPLKPEGYTSLNAIWKHFGYQSIANLITYYPWKDIDQMEITQHPMMFWVKSLEGIVAADTRKLTHDQDPHQV
jgi:GNAT superfamily N-acetyltransferase